MHSMHALIIDGKIFACPMADWQATGSFFVSFVRVFFCVIIEVLCGH